MNTPIAAAGALAFLVGLVHSLLGETMIFRRLRNGGVIPSHGGKLLGEGHVRILWASWHLVTLFGWLMAAELVWLAQSPDRLHSNSMLLSAMAWTTFAGAWLVLIATKARHPGWVALFGVAGLVWLGQSA